MGNSSSLVQTLQTSIKANTVPESGYTTTSKNNVESTITTCCLWSSFSTGLTSPPVPVSDTGGVDGASQKKKALGTTAKYILLATGAVLAITFAILTTIALVCVCRSKIRKRAKRRMTSARISCTSDFVYNLNYEWHPRPFGVPNLRRTSTGYHSHWSLTHSDTGSNHYSYPSLATVLFDADCSRASNSNGLSNPQELVQNTYTETTAQYLQIIPNPISIKGTANERVTRERNHSSSSTASKGARSLTHIQLLHSEREYDEGVMYDNPIFKKKEREKSSEKAVSVYYSAPIERVMPTSILLSDNEAYDSGTSPSIPGNSDEDSENNSETSTDSVYYASPTTISKKMEVAPNMAYGSTSTCHS